jgi:tRNA-splicing ligase RtcB (3'-phosphate/5'-hydroxy nucleic acid ligase)
LLVHSGSRHTGLRIANHYHKKAVALKRPRGLQTADDLASLPVDDQIGQDYLHDMAWAASFAETSRERMIEAMTNAIEIDFVPERLIDVPHNYAWIEKEQGGVRIVHRKGATPATEGASGVIPGSMGTASYIVKGLGNQESFQSCSHGAGRLMSRRAAKEQISEALFASSLAETFSTPSRAYIDEAPGAYKDIDRVIERQKDLIDIHFRLRPVITIKGDSRAKED